MFGLATSAIEEGAKGPQLDPDGFPALPRSYKKSTERSELIVLQ